jgi:hypothetical protein
MQMQAADPISPDASLRNTRVKEEKDKDEFDTRSDAHSEEAEAEAEAATQLSNLAYHSVPAKEGGKKE